MSLSEASEASGTVAKKRKRLHDKPKSSQAYLDKYGTQYEWINKLSLKWDWFFCDLHNVFRTCKMQLAVDTHTPINDCASAQRRAGIPAELFLSYGLKFPDHAKSLLT